MLMASALGLLILAGAVLLFMRPSTDTTLRNSPATQAGPASPALPGPADFQTVEVIPVVSKLLDRTIPLPGELQPYLSVDLYPRVTGIIQWIGVDRGSWVKRGDVLVRLVAPELSAHRAEAEAKRHSGRITYEHLATAASTPGVVAPNDLEVAQKTVEADQARVNSLRQLESYLTMSAPFDGVVTERHMHPGAVVSPAGGGPGGTMPILRMEQISHLRLMVPVPEAYVGSLVPGQKVQFTVPAFPAEKFSGNIARIAGSVDMKTRTMPVEMDVQNPTGRLAPGMFPEVEWPVRRAQPTLFVPAKAIVTTTELAFVLRVQSSTVEWVRVRRGQPLDNLVEVFGDLHAGDQVVLRGTDELRPGTKVRARLTER